MNRKGRGEGDIRSRRVAGILRSKTHWMKASNVREFAGAEDVAEGKQDIRPRRGTARQGEE